MGETLWQGFLGTKEMKYPSTHVFKGISKVPRNLINLQRQTSISVPICSKTLTVCEIVLTNLSFSQALSTKVARTFVKKVEESLELSKILPIFAE